MSQNILIVEDESIVSMELESYLRRRGYNIVAICSNADDAYEKAINNPVDLILMDIYLIESDGIEATARIKEVKPDMPVIFLTAYMDEKTIDRAIEVNPVSYLVKPFNRKELLAAIKIGLKNSMALKSNDMLVGDIVLDDEFSYDTNLAQIIFRGEIISLSKNERALLSLFLDNINKLISFETMEYEIWDDELVSASRRRSLISRLKVKLKHKFIKSCSSEGYIFNI
jgi:DNA-binding response OmpR family regulator